MIANADIQPNTVEQLCGGLKGTTDSASDCQQLAQENSCLRVIIAELLLKNQNLRWALLGQGSGLLRATVPGIPQRINYAPDRRLLIASEGTPLCKNSRTAGIP